MSRSEFDSARFHRALDSTRSARSLNWKQVAEGSGVSASTLTRIAQGKRPDVDSMAALINWSGLSADEFVTGTRRSGAEPLSQITSVLSGDENLSNDARDAMIGMVTAAYERLSKNRKES